MNTPNPFIPQGSLEQKNRKRTRFQVAVFAIFAFNILVITPMLIQGCKRETPPDTNSTAQTPVDTSTPTPTADTNTTPAALPAPPTNVVSAPIPAPAPAPAPAPIASTTEYVIVKGDTLDSIHKKYSVSVKAIEDANPGIVPTKLHPGQKLQIPAATAPASSGTVATAPDGSEVYVVKAGDTLSKIATAHSTSAKAIETLNNLKSTKIKVGDKLKMPPPKATPPTTTVAPAPAASAPAPAPAAPAPASQ